jgi:adenylate cyclase
MPAYVIDAQPDHAAPDLAPALAAQPVILFVDDEPNILSALKRLFRGSGFKLLTADSGAAGLALLEQEPVDLIISDMRMPGMSGAQFLAHAKQLYPDTVRMLLTGYAEMDATISAINDGGIYHYLQKPWDEKDLLLTVQHALEQQDLKRQTARLSAVVQRQNEQLKAFNHDLEVQVAARTGEIQQTVLFLESTQDELKKNFTTMLKVFSNVIELRAGMLGGNASRVADLSQRLGRKFELPEMAVQELMVAGLLHAIGKLGLPDELIRTPLDRLSGEQTKQYMLHALKGQNVLMPLESLAGAGRIIRHQYERYDGRGTPAALSGEEIPLGARILAVVRDFEALRSGAVADARVPDERVVSVLVSQRGHRYDPQVVDHFVALLSEPGALQPHGTRLVSSQELAPGQRLAEDLITPEGVLLLTKDSVITPHYVAQIRKYEEIENAQLRILVLA